MPNSLRDVQATDRARIVLTCMDALMPRAQGCAEAAYNPLAFPPSLAVGCRKVRLQGRRTTAGMQEVEQRRERLPR